MKRYRWIYAVLPITAATVLIGVITNAWSPYAPIVVLVLVGLYVYAGCSARQGEKYTAGELDNLAEIRVYSAESGELIKTITNEEVLYQFNHCAVFDDMDIEKNQSVLEKDLDGAKALYSFVSYKYPAERFGSKKLEENVTVTVFEGKNIVKMAVTQKSVKAFSVPEEFLTFYFEASEKEMEFYWGLVE